MWKSTYDILSLSIWICQFSSLITFSITKQGTSKSIIRKVYNVLLLLIISAYSLGGNLYYLFTEGSHLSTTMLIILLFMGLQCQIHTSFVILNSIRNENIHIQFLDEITKYDMKIAQMGFRFDSNNIKRQHRIICLYKFLLFAINTSIKCIWHIWINLLVPAYIFGFIIHYLPIMIIYFISVLYSNYMLYIRMRCKNLNNELRKIVTLNNEACGNNLTQRFMNICLLYHNLSKIVKHFNKTFGSILLLTIWYSTFSITSDLYLFIVDLKTAKSLECINNFIETMLFIDCVCTFSHLSQTIENEV